MAKTAAVRKTTKQRGQSTKRAPATRTQQKHSRFWLLRSPVVRKTWKWFLLPTLLYLVLFYILQPHYFGNFSNGFYLDNGDGFQNVWNIWWVNESVSSWKDPYYTFMVHWPHGTSLLPQTMNIYNGLVAVPLINVFGFSLIEATNFAVLSAFVFGGVFMFWFIQKLHRRYWVSLLAGALFTFSSYHFAHAQGHLQLVSLQFIPLFLLAFWTFLEKMRYRYAALAAGALFLVMLCDYYYLFWCIIVGGMWFLWSVWKKYITLNRETIKRLLAFVFIAGLLIGPVIRALLRLNKTDPLLGSHDPSQFALDPLTPIIPGGSSYWHSLTDWHWEKLPYLSEMSVFFGLALVAVLIYCFVGLFRKKKFKAPGWLNFWWVVFFSFAVISLGPRPTLFGKTAHDIPLPYALFERVFPTLKISGMPVRFILISLIAAIVIVSFALARLNLKTRKGWILAAVFIAFSFIEMYPRKLPLTSPAVQPYVNYLKELPPGAVIDNGALSGAEQLYNQTVHEHPQAFGYVTRLPTSVDKKDFLIFAALEEGRHDQLCATYKVRYVTIPVERPLKTTFPVIYNDGKTLIYDLKNSENC